MIDVCVAVDQAFIVKRDTGLGIIQTGSLAVIIAKRITL